MKRSALTQLTTERVLDVAGRLFYELGIHSVGVDLIAGEAGVTKKTLYARFGSKDALVELRDRLLRAILAVPVLFAGASKAPAGEADRIEARIEIFGFAGIHVLTNRTRSRKREIDIRSRWISTPAGSRECSSI